MGGLCDGKSAQEVQQSVYFLPFRHIAGVAYLLRGYYVDKLKLVNKAESLLRRLQHGDQIKLRNFYRYFKGKKSIYQPVGLFQSGKIACAGI